MSKVQDTYTIHTSLEPEKPRKRTAQGEEPRNQKPTAKEKRILPGQEERANVQKQHK